PMDIASMSETVAFIKEHIENKVFLQHVVVNVAKIINMQHDEQLAQSVKECDLINIDGMGVVFGARFLGYRIKERVAGVDLFFELLSMSSENGLPVFLLGATDDVVNLTVKNIHSSYPNLKIAGFHNGYFWEKEKIIVDKIKESGARLLFVAITSPKKENFINKWKDDLGVDFVMGVGGTFDVVAGKVKRAPTWMQRAGLEWLYRVFQEPRRMWKRYLVTNSKFLYLLVKARFSNHKSKL
ncbi:WecB/TagA/CpsF family glycosyltransferase, partial [Vibrio sp. V23_P3S9T160]